MDRAEAGGVGVALVGHAAVLAVLSLGLMRAAGPPASPEPIEVSFVDEIALRSASPMPSAAPPPPSAAPELGSTEEASPAPSPAPAPPEPAVVRPAPTRQAAPPTRDTRDRRRPEETRAGQRERNRGSRLADLDLSGLGRDPSPSRRPQPAPAATMNSQAAANIAQAIARQVQPCADRQVYPGPGAERIVTTLNLKLNRDGSLGGPPRLVRQSGVDEENRRYAQRVADLAIRSFVACSPLRGLPDELYDVPRGWSNFTMNYRMPG